MRLSRFIGLLIALLFCVLVATYCNLSWVDAANIAANNAANIPAYCPTYSAAHITTIRVFDPTTGQSVAITDGRAESSLLGWDANDSLWRGYGAKEPLPEAQAQRWRFTFALPGRSDPRGIDITYPANEPDAAFAYVYREGGASTDARGQHLGRHLCRAFRLSRATVEATINRIRELVGVHLYPKIDVYGKGWIRVIAFPLFPRVNLRAVPSVKGNDPTGVLERPTPAWALINYVSGWNVLKIGNNVFYVRPDVARLERAA